MASLFLAVVRHDEANQDHDRNLRALMERCKEKDLKLNPDKIQLRSRETKAIRDMPVPTDKLGVQQLLGMVNYVQKFAPKLPEITMK